MSLKATIRLTLLLVVWSVILTAAALFGAVRHKDATAFATQQAAAITTLAAQDLAWFRAHEPEADLTAWLERAGAWPGVYGLCVLEHGRLVSPEVPGMARAHLERLARTANGSIFLWMERAARPGYRLCMQLQPVPPPEAGLVLALALEVPAQPVIGGIAWSFFVPVAIIGLLGVCIGILWLSHEVVRPIELLSRIDKDQNLLMQLDEPTSAARYAEFTRLAQTLRGMHMDMEQWRSKADQLERSIDQKVAEQTRQIHKTLQRAKREIWRDPLTGLYNRRMLDENGPRIHEEQQHAGADLSLVMLDVDHFKTLNDTLGHMAGDEMLQFTANLLKQIIRREDVAIRYGGDEFCLLLPGVTAPEAEQVAARIVSLFAQHTRLLANLNPKPSLSAGVASLAMTQARDVEDLMRLADAALYQAKRAGKGRVGVYDPTRPPRPEAGADREPAGAAAHPKRHPIGASAR